MTLLPPIFAGATVLVSHDNGDFSTQALGVEGAPPPEQVEGLLDRDCRVLSRRVLTLDGKRVISARGRVGPHHRSFMRGRVPLADSELPEDALDVEITRSVGAGLLEEIVVHNRSMRARDVVLRLDVDADFRDVLELRSRPSIQPTITRVLEGDATGGALRIEGRFSTGDSTMGAREHRRAAIVRMEATDVVVDEGGFVVRARLGAARSSNATLRVKWSLAVVEDGALLRAPSPELHAHEDVAVDAWRASRPRLSSTSASLNRAFATAVDDLFALRLDPAGLAPDSDIASTRDHLDVHRAARTPRGVVVGAGAPTYAALFGRDALTASWQGALLGPELLRGALTELAARLGRADDDFRDEEPGRILHEARDGPLSILGLRPHSGYYGTTSAPAMFTIALSEAYHWSGDRGLLLENLDPAQRALAWCIERGDVDGDGFLESRTHSAQGLENQGWRDSREAIRHDDGSRAEGPIATLEEQSFLLLAFERMAEILVFLEDDTGAALWNGHAHGLRRAIHKQFWLPDDGFYAGALDGQKRPVTSVTSAPLHALAAGAVPADKALAVALRLLQPDLWSGYGVRTLSTEHPSFNPYAYHLGAVWPVEAATFIVGLKRYGLHDLALTVAEGLLRASAGFPDGRLPEALTGHAGPDPVPYPAACSPQAWSASAVVLALQATLGIYPFAPARTLTLVHPRLPVGVEHLVLEDVRVGDARVTLGFERADDAGRCRCDILDKSASLRVVRAPSPVDARGDGPTLDRLRRFVLAHAPGRTAKAVRLALQ